MAINVQTGSTGSDSSYTTALQIRQRIADIRRARGLAPDPASDAIWVQRVLSGTHSIGDARTAITRKGVETALSSYRASVGLGSDPDSDRIWVNRILSGAATLDSAYSRIGGKAVDEGAVPPGDWADEVFDEVDQPAMPTGTATAIIENYLSNYGLTFDRAQIANWVAMLSDSGQSMMPIIEQEVRDSTQFRERFPGIQARLDAGMNAISVNEYLALENSYTSIMRTAGMPSGFYDSPTDFAEFIAHNVSPAELEQRVTRGVVAAQQAPQEVKDALQQFYGVRNSIGALAAYYLDPDKALPVIEREFQAAQVKGAATRFQFGLNRDQSEQFASLGVDTMQQAMSGFAQSSRVRGLATATIGEQNTISERDLHNASFGFNGESERLLRDRLATRRAQFAGSSGGAMSTNQGTSLGAQR